MTAVSLNVCGGVRLIKAVKLCKCMQTTTNTTRTDALAPGVCGNGSVPLSHSGNVVTRIGIHTHILTYSICPFKVKQEQILVEISFEFFALGSLQAGV